MSCLVYSFDLCILHVCIFVVTEMWTISKDSTGTIAYVRNLYWEGYSFYAMIGANEYGGAYFGLGVPNYDIAFML